MAVDNGPRTIIQNGRDDDPSVVQDAQKVVRIAPPADQYDPFSRGSEGIAVFVAKGQGVHKKPIIQLAHVGSANASPPSRKPEVFNRDFRNGVD